jgi:predicted aldo/keto reductase-like oxidoreductase
MEPVKGGALASLPEPVAEILRRANPSMSQASWGIRFAASLDGIITVLSGMSNMEQMKDNLSVMEHFAPLSADESRTIAEVQRELAKSPKIPCTDCQYCLKSCPQGIAIPGVFKAVNDYLAFNDLKRAKGKYGWETMGAGKASMCMACGQCETACPQSIGIIGELSNAAKLFEQ